MSERLRAVWPAYALAAVGTAAAALAGNALAARLDFQLAPTLLAVAIVASAWLGGVGPGLLATALGAIHLLIGPVAWLRNGGRSDFVLLVVSGVLASVMAGALRRARRAPAGADDAAPERAADDGASDVELRLDVGERGHLAATSVAGALHHLLGYDDDDDVTAHDGWRVLLHPDDRVVAERLLRGALGGATGQAVLRYVTRGGAPLPMALHLQPRLDRWGEVTSVRLRLRRDAAGPGPADGAPPLAEGLARLRSALAGGASWPELEALLLDAVREATGGASAGLARRADAAESATLARMARDLSAGAQAVRVSASELELHAGLAVSERRTSGAAMPRGFMAAALRDGDDAPIGWLWAGDAPVDAFSANAALELEAMAGIATLLLSRQVLVERLAEQDRRERLLRSTLSQAQARVEGRSAQLVQRIDQLLASARPTPSLARRPVPAADDQPLVVPAGR